MHVWDCEAGQLRELGSVGAESAPYGDAVGWDKMIQAPAVAWHPQKPILVVANTGEFVQWAPAGLPELEGLPPTAPYQSLAFSPNGRTLWASPSWADSQSSWESSDVIDLASGTVRIGPAWDTGVAMHPAGGLAATLSSEQGATHGLFARIDHDSDPGEMRLLRRALILDADGYEAPIFSSDGRHLAIRGNAYEETLHVFEFPSLRLVLATTLDEPDPGVPYPQDWLDRQHSWSRYNIAFAAQPGMLWIATPTGMLLEVDVEKQSAVEHDVLAGTPVSALGATATGELVVAGSGGELVLLSVRSDSAQTARPDGEASQDAVEAFLNATSEIPQDAGLEEHLEKHLEVTDGARSWNPEDLSAVTTAADTDPMWLRHRAAINNLFNREDSRTHAPKSTACSSSSKRSAP